jgi:hypothetical protein
VIDHRRFPRERYFELLEELLIHSRRYLTTKGMAQYVMNVTGHPNAKNVLYLHAPHRKAPLRAQGNYNSWTLFHGFRSLLGAGAVDIYQVPFLYQQPDSVMAAQKKSLYGRGFGYAYRLPDIPVDRRDIPKKIREHFFDFIIYADPTSMIASANKQLKFLPLIAAFYQRDDILFVHAPDIAYPNPTAQGYSPSYLYQNGVVLQREIMDCAYFVPPDRKSESMKRCVWYHNQNCFDDVNVQSTMKEKKLREYPWRLRTFNASSYGGGQRG